MPPGAQVDTEIRAKARQPFLRGSAVNRIVHGVVPGLPVRRRATGARPGTAAGGSAPPNVPTHVPAEADPVEVACSPSRSSSPPDRLRRAATAGERRGRAGHGPPGATPDASPPPPAESNAIFLVVESVPERHRLRHPPSTTPERAELGPGRGPRRRHRARLTVDRPRSRRAALLRRRGHRPRGRRQLASQRFRLRQPRGAGRWRHRRTSCATEAGRRACSSWRWEYPTPARRSRSPSTSTTRRDSRASPGWPRPIELEPREQTYEATLVGAGGDGDQSSDFSNIQT